MKKNSSKENKTCFILYTISSSLFLLTAVMQYFSNDTLAISNLGLSICFGSLAYIYYKKFKEQE